MAIIQSYPSGTPKLTDTIIGVEYKENEQPATKSFTINDIVELVPTVDPIGRPYKVYTALLTQSGGNNVQGISNGNLLIGRTYYINYVDGGPDFTNVGAPNNNVGTYFVATGTTPNTWGVTPASFDTLTYNTGAPVVTVLENTIGNIYWVRQNTGAYNCISSGLFPESKTFITISALGRPLIFAFRNNSNNQIQIQTTNIEFNNIEWNNEAPGNFEIRVYN
jgi:hypothetical protein